MRYFTALIVVLYVFVQTTATVLDDSCLNGVTSPETCCKGVPESRDVLLRNPSDCNTYYQCVHQIPMLRKCPVYLHWSVKRNRCEWPIIADCHSNRPGGKCSNKPSDGCLIGLEDPIECCKPYSSWMNILLKNKYDCKSYYVCENGIPLLKKCPTGLEWSVTELRCDSPNVANCELKPPVTESPVTEPTISTTTSAPTTACPSPPLKVSDDCLKGIVSPSVCCKDVPYWKNVFLKNPADCHTYYSCIKGVPVLKPCPAGLHWSVTLQRCEWPSIASCASCPDDPIPRPSECLTGTVSGATCCLGVPYWIDVLLQNPKDCGTYYQCVHEKPVLRPCPAGLHWSVSANRCDWPSIAGCSSDSELITPQCLSGLSEPEICCKGISDSLGARMRNRKDCGTYYECVSEKPILRSCPTGLEFSTDTRNCEWSAVAKCTET